jgi:plastocyanin
MRVLAAALVAALAVVPAADARRHRRPLRGHVRHMYAVAPAGWATPATPTATPTPAPTPMATPTPAPTSSLPPVNTRSVSVGSTEFAFTLSQQTVSAGTVHIEFDNSRAQDAHQLAIDGPDPDYWAFDKQGAGTVSSHTVTLRPGTYVLFCPILDHESRGMHATLTVR